VQTIQRTTSRTTTRSTARTTLTTLTTPVIIEPKPESDDLLAILLGVFIPLTFLILVGLVVFYLYRTGKLPIGKSKDSSSDAAYIDDKHDIPMQSTSTQEQVKMSNMNTYGSTSNLNDK
jgi:hypothetical protein